MRIACISDTHNRHRDIVIPRCNILVAAGDLTWRGEIDFLHDFCDWTAKLKRDGVIQEVVAIAGNHDLCFDPRVPDTSEAMAFAARYAMEDGGVIYLEDSWREVMGLMFYGHPWTPRFGRWGFAVDSREQELSKFRGPQRAVDVLVSHGPPRGILDIDYERSIRCGSEALREVVERRNWTPPKLHVFGHLHPSRGIATNGRTTFVNAASVDKNFQVLSPIVVDFV